MINLDSQQRAVVETKSPRALCLAGAGSGKTRSLIERIAHLVENCKVHPSEVLAFTFTRKAAGEIGSRLEERIGADAFGVTMGTMHGVALNYIQRFAELIGLRRGRITVYSQWEQDFLLKEIAMELGLHTGKSWRKGLKKKDVDALFSGYYERGVWPSPNAPGYGLFKTFLQRCRENNALTYGTILVEFRTLLPKIAQYINIRHLMVDEAQDNDPLQWLIVNQIVELTGADLFVVADVDQSIYSFRGAVPEYLVNNADSFDLYKIETNYRSTTEIVTAANALIEHNQARLKKTMVPNASQPGAWVRVTHRQDSTEISSFVEDFINNAHGVGIENIAIIARNHALLNKISDALTEKGIPNTYTGKESKLTNSEEFRRFHAFLKLIANPYDNFSFLLIKDLIGVSDLSGIRLQAVQEGKSQFQVWVESGPDVDPFKNIGHMDFDAAIDHFAFWCQSLFGISDIAAFAKAWGLAEPNIRDTACDESPIQNYLKWLATYDIQDEIEDEPEGVQIMTIHAAKGLEFPVVIVAGVNDGILPSKHGLKSEDEMESERRLAYVGWTRAESQLILAVRPEEKLDDYGRLHKNPASRFIEESGL